jgi:hypothetical protein
VWTLIVIAHATLHLELVQPDLSHCVDTFRNTVANSYPYAGEVRHAYCAGPRGERVHLFPPDGAHNLCIPPD